MDEDSLYSKDDISNTTSLRDTMAGHDCSMLHANHLLTVAAEQD